MILMRSVTLLGGDGENPEESFLGFEFPTETLFRIISIK
jgi:hypothetical protein